MRAILLEFAYRNQPALVQAGATYAEAPPWLIDGMASLASDPDPEAGSGLFRSLIASGRTPTLATFLSENPATLDTPSRRLYSACSMSLVRLLLGQVNGHVLMQEFIRHWPGPMPIPRRSSSKPSPASTEAARASRNGGPSASPRSPRRIATRASRSRRPPSSSTTS